MFHTQEGRDYQLYKIYIWAGLAAIVIFCFFVVLSGISQNSNTTLIILNIPITLWVLGILAYWWWVFLFKGREELIRSIEDPTRHKSDLSNLKNWTTLFTSMAGRGENKEKLLEYEKKALRPVLVWYGLQNFLALWVMGNFWVWTIFQDKLPGNYIQTVWVPGVLIILFVLLLSPVFLFRLFGSDPDAYMKPLGLFVSRTPLNAFFPAEIPDSIKGTLSKGATLMGGKRNGRDVFIETRGKHYFTWVEGLVPSFEAESLSGKFITDESSPSIIKEFFSKLPKAKRWKGVKVTGDGSGIQIERNSRGQNMWLYDLWLAEQLWEKLDPKRKF